MSYSLEKTLEEIQQATRDAFKRALGNSEDGILCIKDGWLIRIKRDGEYIRIRPSKPTHKVEVGKIIQVDS